MKPIRRGPIKFGGYDNNELLCPRCGGDYLHHERVTTFDRGEDAKNVDLTEIGRGTIFRAVVPSEIANNPSAPQWRCHYFLVQVLRRLVRTNDIPTQGAIPLRLARVP